MSMARQLMTGGYIGSLECSINPARYGHDGGALAIAMESVEELHEIFLEGYNFEQADLAAAIEGVALEGSQYEAVAEAAINDTFKKIKDFFVKLWNKVKAFFHEVRKYLDSIFMSGKEFAKKYQKEINKLSNVKDLSVKMFKYRNDKIEDMTATCDIEATVDLVTVNVRDLIDASKTITKDQDLGDTSEKAKASLKELKDTTDEDILGATFQGAPKDAADFDEFLFGLFREGATSQDDKEEQDLTKSDITEFMNTLINSKAASSFDKVQNASDKVYRKATKTVDDAAKVFDNAKGKGASTAAESLREYSSIISREQGFVNRYINAWKTAVKERDAAYKSAIMAAFSNNRKNSKNK